MVKCCNCFARLWQWFLTKIKYHELSLKTQM